MELTRPLASGLAGLLASRREEIVQRFVGEVGSRALPPPGTQRWLLEDHIPAFLDEIAEELREGGQVRPSSDALDTSQSAREHGQQRHQLGYDLPAMVREYGVLRRCILAAAADAGLALTLDEFEVLAKCLNVGVAEAASAYASYRDGQLEQERANLAFLAEAGQLLSSSLDYRATLTRLCSLIVPRLADWCAVHIEGMSAHEMPLAHVQPELVEPLRQAYARYSDPQRSPLGGPLRAGEPVLVPRVDRRWLRSLAHDEQHLALLERIASCSYMILPLAVQDNTFGALTLAYSVSGRRYGSADLPLAQELARRAAVAIDNARLYSQSQAERARFEAASRAKDELVALVSHELRTPLHAIVGWTRLLRSGAVSPDSQAHALEVMERNAAQQDQVISDLLDLSGAMTGRLSLQPSEVQLGAVIERAIAGVRASAAHKELRLELELEPGQLVVRGDGERLQQVVWNLLSNAVKFSRPGGVVRVRVAGLRDFVEVTVEDQGQGIDPSFLPHVFESFRQSDSSSARPHGGLGIGLSIAKHLVELHGGTIAASSDGRDCGARFRVQLPIGGVVEPASNTNKVPATKVETKMKQPLQGLAGLEALVVDDEPDARELVAYVLSRSGITVLQAESASEALALLNEREPHVIVSDIGMPDEDGYSLIRKVRTLLSETKRATPAIALTAFTTNHDRTRALLAGFNMHLSKPIEPSVLVSAVAQVTGRPLSE